MNIHSISVFPIQQSSTIKNKADSMFQTQTPFNFGHQEQRIKMRSTSSVQWNLQYKTSRYKTLSIIRSCFIKQQVSALSYKKLPLLSISPPPLYDHFFLRYWRGFIPEVLLYPPCKIGMTLIKIIILPNAPLHE